MEHWLVSSPPSLTLRDAGGREASAPPFVNDVYRETEAQLGPAIGAPRPRDLLVVIAVAHRTRQRAAGVWTGRNVACVAVRMLIKRRGGRVTTSSAPR